MKIQRRRFLASAGAAVIGAALAPTWLPAQVPATVTSGLSAAEIDEFMATTFERWKKQRWDTICESYEQFLLEKR